MNFAFWHFKHSWTTDISSSLSWSFMSWTGASPWFFRAKNQWSIVLAWWPVATKAQWFEIVVCCCVMALARHLHKMMDWDILDYVWLHDDYHKFIATQYISIKWVCQTTHWKQPKKSCKVSKWRSSCFVCCNLNKWMKVQKAIPGDPAGPTSSTVAPQRRASERASSRSFKNSRRSSWVPELQLFSAAIFHWFSM